jgi:hypothetical protein
MRPWTYLLPMGLWLFLARRLCERMQWPGGTVINAGRGVVLVDRAGDPR